MYFPRYYVLVQLTDRQAEILRAVVREYLRTKRPVGSKSLVEQGEVAASPSTVRYDLGRLEQAGLLEHPHTSSGRVPTDLGWRFYVANLMELERQPRHVIVHHQHETVVATADRFDTALREVTEAIADATELLALVTAPRTHGTVIRHIEVLLLKPTMVVVVCITETGDVNRKVITLPEPADPGLVDWAGAYLNEQVAGLALGQNLLRQRLAAPQLSPAERHMLATLAPAFTDLIEESNMVIEGTAALVGEMGNDVGGIADLVQVLDERRRLLEALRRASAGGSIAVCIGSENELPELRPLSIVGGTYGLPTRPLGMVGVIGPRNMDYPRAVGVVHAAIDSLSHVVGELYEA
jgi:heat-inducible transcriptional repressor